MAFTVSFGKTNKRRNSTLVPSVGASTQVLLKENTSVYQPIFIIRLGKYGAPASLKELSEMNYCYCSELKRYYYITDIVSGTAVLAYIYCQTDVLATFKEDILSTPAFVMYSQSRYNLNIEDNRLRTTSVSHKWTKSLETAMFNEAGAYVLAGVSDKATGETGSASAFLTNAGGIANVCSKLYAQDFWESIKTDFYHPEEAILSCIWTPLNYSMSSSGSANISIGKYNIAQGLGAAKTVTGTVVLNFHIPHTNQDGQGTVAGDYRNFAPYTRYYATLPGVGMVEVPMHLIAGHSYTAMGQFIVTCEVAASPITGDVTYVMKLQDTGGGISGDAGAVIFKGNFGVDIPISRTVGHFGSIIGSVLAAPAQVIGGFAIGNAPGAIAGGVSALSGIAHSAVESMNVNTTVAGALGGWSINPRYNYMVEATTVSFDVSDEPSLVAPTIGCPYFHHVSSLGELKGYVNCCGCHVKTWGMQQELDMISSFVNSAVNSFGGIIIE